MTWHSERVDGRGVELVSPELEKFQSGCEGKSLQ